MVEAKLAEELKVGISPVREALQQLEHIGLVTRFLNRGSYITKLSLNEVKQIYRLRGELETLSLKFALEAPERPNVDALQECAHELIRAATESSRSKFVHWDLQFHQQMCRIASDPFLEKCLLMLITPLFAFVLIRLQHEPPVPFNIVEVARQHQQIVDLFELRNTTKALQRMRAVMEGFRHEIIETLYGPQ